LSILPLYNYIKFINFYKIINVLKITVYINPLSADVLYVSHTSVLACSTCRASHRQNAQKGKTCYQAY